MWTLIFGTFHLGYTKNRADGPVLIETNKFSENSGRGKIVASKTVRVDVRCVCARVGALKRVCYCVASVFVGGLSVCASMYSRGLYRFATSHRLASTKAGYSQWGKVLIARSVKLSFQVVFQTAAARGAQLLRTEQLQNRTRQSATTYPPL